jgi:hypothetical protein
VFHPFGMDLFGAFGEDARALIKMLSKRVAERFHMYPGAALSSQHLLVASSFNHCIASHLVFCQLRVADKQLVPLVADQYTKKLKLQKKSILDQLAANAAAEELNDVAAALSTPDWNADPEHGRLTVNPALAGNDNEVHPAKEHIRNNFVTTAPNSDFITATLSSDTLQADMTDALLCSQLDLTHVDSSESLCRQVARTVVAADPNCVSPPPPMEPMPN